MVFAPAFFMSASINGPIDDAPALIYRAVDLVHSLFVYLRENSARPKKDSPWSP
jgi:hypothetical protein